jgi:hypothetical protein
MLAVTGVGGVVLQEKKKHCHRKQLFTSEPSQHRQQHLIQGTPARTTL